MRHVQHGLFALALFLGASYVVAQGPPPFELKPRPLSAGGVVNNPLLLPAGSESAPSVTFASETTKGLYSSAAAQISLATGSTERVRFTPDAIFQLNDSGYFALGAATDVRLARGAAGLLNITDADSTPDLNFNLSGSPTLSTCGDGALATGSSNTSGRVTSASTMTACTLTFSSSFGGNSTDCLMANLVANRGFVSAASATAMTVTGLTGGDDFMYLCVGR